MIIISFYEIVTLVIHKILGLTPVDGVPIAAITSINLPVQIVLTFLELGGIAFAIICFVFNIVYRKKK